MTWILRVLLYLSSRLQEPSTMRGVVMISTGVGVAVEPDHLEAIVAAGTVVAGVIGAAMPDTLRRGDGE
jgi:hypothetical protein